MAELRGILAAFEASGTPAIVTRLAAIEEEARTILRLPSNEPLDRSEGFFDMGMDSLMAVELRNALGVSLKYSLPATLLFDYPTLDTLADFLVKELWPVETPPTPSVVEEDRAILNQAAELAELSEAEAEALLLQELTLNKRGHRNG